MIAQLSGVIAEKFTDQVVVDCNGVGYGTYITSEDHGNLQVGEHAKLFIYEHIRENSHELFAFCSMPTKKLFELLLSVNGVGPKMALSILSIASGDAVKAAIASGDTKFISQANGVGKRVAERVVVDLKDKVGLQVAGDATSFLADTNSSLDEAVQGLLALGFSSSDASEALRGVEPTLSTEERIKLALKSRF